MARTVTTKKVHVPGDLKEVIYEVTGDNSYPAGGYPFAGTDTDVKLEAELNDVGVGRWRKSDGSGAFIASFDDTNNKIQAFTAAAVPGGGVALVEVDAGTNLSTYKVRLRVLGRGSAGV